jgi:hypothetical protein
LEKNETPAAIAISTTPRLAFHQRVSAGTEDQRGVVEDGGGFGGDRPGVAEDQPGVAEDYRCAAERSTLRCRKINEGREINAASPKIAARPGRSRVREDHRASGKVTAHPRRSPRGAEIKLRRRGQTDPGARTAGAVT